MRDELLHRINALLDRATHDGTPEEEARTSALIAARMIRKEKLVLARQPDSQIARQPEREASPRSPQSSVGHPFDPFWPFSSYPFNDRPFSDPVQASSITRRCSFCQNKLADGERCDCRKARKWREKRESSVTKKKRARKPRSTKAA